MWLWTQTGRQMKGNRPKTIHGVVIPPRKKKLGRRQAFTINFVLTGIVPSKKNRQLATINYNKILKQFRDRSVSGKIDYAAAKQILLDNKPFIRYSKGFQAWEEEALNVLQQQAASWRSRLVKKGYEVFYPITDCSVKIYHYWKDNNVRDNSGKAETIHDLLVKAGIITNDSWQHLTPNEADADLYDTEILDHITEIQVTAYHWLKKQ
jgi:hypothetical protein